MCQGRGVADRVGIEKQHALSGGLPEAEVVCAAEPKVSVRLDGPHPGEIPPDDLAGPVARRVVHDDDLDIPGAVAGAEPPRD
jgi:hypothetical protein